MRAFVFIVSLIFAIHLSSCATRVVTRPRSNTTIIKTLPKQYKIVRVKGQPYYYFKGQHYRKTRQGYILVRL